MYNLPFFGAVVMNFVFPILILITDFKRISWILVMAGVVILAGHYIDFFQYGYAWYGWRQMVYMSEIASVMFLVYLSLLCLRHWLNILC
jgi:hypothetical protein